MLRFISTAVALAGLFAAAFLATLASQTWLTADIPSEVAADAGLDVGPLSANVSGQQLAAQPSPGMFAEPTEGRLGVREAAAARACRPVGGVAGWPTPTVVAAGAAVGLSLAATAGLPLLAFLALAAAAWSAMEFQQVAAVAGNPACGGDLVAAAAGLTLSAGTAAALTVLAAAAAVVALIGRARRRAEVQAAGGDDPTLSDQVTSAIRGVLGRYLPSRD